MLIMHFGIPRNISHMNRLNAYETTLSLIYIHIILLKMNPNAVLAKLVVLFEVNDWCAEPKDLLVDGGWPISGIQHNRIAG